MYKCFLFCPAPCSSSATSVSFPFLTSYMHNCYLQWGGWSCAEGGGGWLTRSPCRATAAVGRGGGSSCAQCKATAGSSRSSPPPTGTGCGVSAGAGKAPSRSWGRWCSPWRRQRRRRRWTWVEPGVPVCSRCRTRRCCRGWWEGQSGGRCRVGNWETTKITASVQQCSNIKHRIIIYHHLLIAHRCWHRGVGLVPFPQNSEAVDRALTVQVWLQVRRLLSCRKINFSHTFSTDLSLCSFIRV